MCNRIQQYNTTSCQIINYHDLGESENMKHKPVKVMNYTFKLFKYLKIVFYFDPSDPEPWEGEYEYKWQRWQTEKVGGTQPARNVPGLPGPEPLGDLQGTLTGPTQKLMT